MKACPGLRSGIDRSGSRSDAIRPPLGSGWGVAGIPSPIRCTPQIRFFIPSSFRRRPESEGVGRLRQPLIRHSRQNPPRPPIFILLCGLREAMVIPAIKSMPRTPIRGWNPDGEGRPAHPCHIESL